MLKGNALLHDHKVSPGLRWTPPPHQQDCHYQDGFRYIMAEVADFICNKPHHHSKKRYLYGCGSTEKAIKKLQKKLKVLNLHYCNPMPSKCAAYLLLLSNVLYQYLSAS